MSATTDYNKIEKVLSKISGKELKEFVRFYALTHNDLATALVEKYCKPERGNWKEMVDEAMPLLCRDDEKAFMAHISKRLKNKKEPYFHYRYIIHKADYWIAHGKRAKAEKLMMEKKNDQYVRDHYIDCLTEWREYRKAVDLIDDNDNDFNSSYHEWEEKLVKILQLSGDKDWLIEECRRRCINGYHKVKYYKALKEVIAKEEWPDYMTRLWDEIDWEKDYEDAEAKIAIEEKWFDRMLAFFKHKGWIIWEIYPKYIKYVPKEDQSAVGELICKDIERLAMLKEKPKEFAWLLSYVEGVMGLSSVVDGVIKDGIRKLIAEHPDKVYMRNYLGSVL